MYGVDLIRAQRGLITWLAPRIGLTQPAISLWERVPAERVLEIEKVTGIPRHLLRPDLWTPPWCDDAPKGHWDPAAANGDATETLPQPKRRTKRTNIETTAA